MDIELLRKLSNAFGPPGDEEEPREILRKDLGPISDKVEVDKLGNIFFHHSGKSCEAPLVMLAAHMDEVALLTTYIDKEGFIRFHTLGGIPDGIMPGQRFAFNGRKGFLKGIIGTKPPHIMTQEERNKLVPREALFVDIGAESKETAEEKGGYIGMTGVFDVQFEELGNGYLRDKAFDDRAGCFVMAEAFKDLKDAPFNVVAVGTVQEEIGLRGARTSAWQLEPDYALALEGTFAADVPGSSPHQTSAALKMGSVVTIADRSIITHPKIMKAIMEAAENENIPYQFKKIPSGGTDAGAIHLTRGGVPAGTLAVPCRYIHGPAAVTHVENLMNTIRLIKAFVEHISIQ